MAMPSEEERRGAYARVGPQTHTQGTGNCDAYARIGQQTHTPGSKRRQGSVWLVCAHANVRT
eukprot:2038508-Rhodomonas_salina.1